MLKLPLSDIKSGMKLAKDVILDDGRLLLLSGFVIKPRYLRKLEVFDIPYVYINEIQIKTEPISTDETIYISAVKSVKNIFNSVREGYQINISYIKRVVNDLISQIYKRGPDIIQLTGISNIKNYTFVHSVDVCIYSIITAMALGFKENELLTIGIASLLHDIGKCKIPFEITSKPGSLSENEFNIMKLHTIYGYEILKNTPQLNNSIANVAWQHHERWDGTGYPLGLRDELITTMSRIVSISDVFDALTSDKVYKKRCLPHQGADLIIENTSKQFDPNIINVFIKNIVSYPEGMVVLLNTKEIGTIIKPNIYNPSKPVIKIISQQGPNKLSGSYFIDLLEKTNVHIVDILS